jgi:hypothetical protein
VTGGRSFLSLHFLYTETFELNSLASPPILVNLFPLIYHVCDKKERPPIVTYAYNRDKGKCKISRKELFPHDVHIHHINPDLPLDKVNKVPNLATVHRNLHQLIHNTEDYSHLEAKVWRKIQDFRNKLIT